MPSPFFLHTACLARLLLACCALLAALPGRAEQDPPMQYRFAVERGIPVIWLHGGIGPKSAAHVAQGLRQRERYQEVWLDSGGGLVSEGFAIGRLLRDLQATVRVPAMDQVKCASSCTNLMLGGYNRIVEDGAMFLVHAASSMSNLSGPQAKVYVREDGKLLAIPAGRLVTLAAQQPDAFQSVVTLVHREQVQDVADMLVYYQDILGGTPQREAYAALARRSFPTVYQQPAGAAGARTLAADAAALRSDGVIALQEILTQTELNAMRGVLAAARQNESTLGRGARVAARLLEATLACRIQDVCLLSRHQLANLGYHNFDRN